MVYFLVKRVLQGFLVVFGVTLAVFIIMRVIPGDPVRLILSGTAPESALEAMRQQLGLTQPLFVQFLHYIGQVAQGDFGHSLFQSTTGASTLSGGAISVSQTDKATVVGMIMKAFPVTLLLVLIAVVFALVISIPLGILSSQRPRNAVDRFIMFVTLVIQSIPNFWLGIMAIILITIDLNLLPSMGYTGFQSAILPGLVLSMSLVPVLTRTIRGAFITALNEPYIEACIARGLPTKQVLFRHVVKNTLIPILTLLGVQVGYLLGGAVVIEFIFNFPGLGLLTINAVLQRDFPVIQGVVVFFGAMFVVINIIVDALYAYIDPRIR